MLLGSWLIAPTLADRLMPQHPLQSATQEVVRAESHAGSLVRAHDGAPASGTSGAIGEATRKPLRNGWHSRTESGSPVTVYRIGHSYSAGGNASDAGLTKQFVRRSASLVPATRWLV
jgi:hypothetical protein